MSARVVSVDFVGDPALKIPVPRRLVAILIGKGIQTSAITPIIARDPVEWVLGGDDMPERILKLPAPAAEHKSEACAFSGAKLKKLVQESCFSV